LNSSSSRSAVGSSWRVSSAGFRWTSFGAIASSFSSTGAFTREFP
jgi:hypothetical protein